MQRKVIYLLLCMAWSQSVFAEITASGFGEMVVNGVAHGVGFSYGWNLGSALWKGTTFIPRYLWRKGKKWNANRKAAQVAKAAVESKK